MSARAPGASALPRRFPHFLREQQASSLVELAIVVPVLLLLLVGAIDFGHGFYLAIEVSSAAQAAAMFGAQNPSDITGINNLARLNAQDVTGLNVATVSGCECSDGTGVAASCAGLSACSVTAVRYVDVTVTGTYVPILRFPGANTDFPLRAHQKLRSTSGS